MKQWIVSGYGERLIPMDSIKYFQIKMAMSEDTQDKCIFSIYGEHLDDTMSCILCFKTKKDVFVSNIMDCLVVWILRNKTENILESSELLEIVASGLGCEESPWVIL